MGLFSPEHVLLVVLVVALLFGAKGVPGLARRAGKGIRETRDALGVDDIRHEITGVRDTLTPAQTAAPAAQPPVATGQPEPTGNVSAGPSGDSPS